MQKWMGGEKSKRLMERALATLPSYLRANGMTHILRGFASGECSTSGFVGVVVALVDDFGVFEA